MASHISAAVLYGPKDLRLEYREIQPPDPGEVQILIKATGLCGSDLHYYNHGRVGAWQLEEPMALGHEAAGVVIATGPNVDELAVGDRVALEVGQPCERCERCKEGRYNLCKDMKFRASAKSKPVYQGTLQDRINAPAKWCHKIPKDMNFGLAALVEPLSVAMHAVRRAQLSDEAQVLVFGSGTVGLLVAAAVRASGSRKVIMADIDSGRLEFAKQNEFTDFIYLIEARHAKTDNDALLQAQQTAESIKTLNDNGGRPREIDAVFECTGVPSCVQAGIYSTRAGGKLILIGIGPPNYLVPVTAAALREVDILGVFRYANVYPSAIRAIYSKERGMQKLEKLITHRFKFLHEAHEALETAGRTKDADNNVVLKVMLETF